LGLHVPISKAIQTIGMPGVRRRAQIAWDDNGLNVDEADEVGAFILGFDVEWDGLRRDLAGGEVYRSTGHEID